MVFSFTDEVSRRETDRGIARRSQVQQRASMSWILTLITVGLGGHQMLACWRQHGPGQLCSGRLLCVPVWGTWAASAQPVGKWGLSCYLGHVEWLCLSVSLLSLITTTCFQASLRLTSLNHLFSLKPSSLLVGPERSLFVTALDTAPPLFPGT